MIDDELWDNLAKDPRPVSSATIDRYRTRIAQLLSLTGMTLHVLLTSGAAEAIRTVRTAHDNHGTRAALATPVMSLYSHSPTFAAKYKAAHDNWRSFGSMSAILYQKKRDNNQVSDDERAKLPTCAEIRKAMETLKKSGLNNLRDSLHYIMLALSVDNPPKRRDLGALQVVSRDSSALLGNYIIVPNSAKPVRLVLQEYKTAKKYGRFEENMSTEVGDAIRDSLKDFPRKFLFVGQKGMPLSDGAYGEFVQAVFKKRLHKHVTINALRHMYITEVADMKTTAVRRELARRMNHSIGMQLEYNVVPM
jgi:hypothetical protein